MHAPRRRLAPRWRRTSFATRTRPICSRARRITSTPRLTMASSPRGASRGPRHRHSSSSSWRVSSGDSKYLIVGESVAQAPIADTVNTYPARIPAQAGDVIGFYAVTAGDCRARKRGYVFRSLSGDIAGPAQIESFPLTGAHQFDLAATLEEDLDADGYGDETQDLCPSDAGTQSPCEIATEPPSSPSPELTECLGASARSIAGGETEDVITGGPDADAIDGAGGDDELRGVGGADCLVGGSGGDLVRGGSGTDAVTGRRGARRHSRRHRGRRAPRRDRRRPSRRGRRGPRPDRLRRGQRHGPCRWRRSRARGLRVDHRQRLGPNALTATAEGWDSAVAEGWDSPVEGPRDRRDDWRRRLTFGKSGVRSAQSRARGGCVLDSGRVCLRRRRTVISFMSVLLVGSVAAIAQAGSLNVGGGDGSETSAAARDLDGRHLYLVPATADGDAAIDEAGARVVADYSSFTLVSADGSAHERMKLAGADRRDDMRTVATAARRRGSEAGATGSSLEWRNARFGPVRRTDQG